MQRTRGLSPELQVRELRVKKQNEAKQKKSESGMAFLKLLGWMITSSVIFIALKSYFPETFTNVFTLETYSTDSILSQLKKLIPK